jgi:hypothetical protein
MDLWNEQAQFAQRILSVTDASARRRGARQRKRS